MNRMSRRSLVRALTVGGAVLATQVSAILPELGLARSANAQSPGARRPRIRPRELRSDELKLSLSAASSHSSIRQLRGLVESSGFMLATEAAMGVRYDADDGAIIGETLVTTLHDDVGGQNARLVHHVAGDQVRSALAMWQDSDPTQLTIYGIRDGSAQMIGRLSLGQDEIVVDDIASGRRVIPRRPPTRSSVRGPGLAALAGPTTLTAAQTCTQNCGWAVGIYCGFVCEYSFFVICNVVLLLTGLPGLACFLVSFAICFFTCWEVQSWACSLICV